MPINPDNLVARAREHVTEQDEAVKYSDERFYALIPSATDEWIRRTKLDSQKRRNFLAETAEIEIEAGVADCLEAIEEVGIQSQFVPEGDVILTNPGGTTLPVQFVPSLSRLTLGGIQDKFFYTVYFDGKLMRFRNPADSLLTTLDGSLRIRAVSVPQTLDDIPESVEGELSTILAELVRKFDTDQPHKGVQLNMRKQR